MPNDLQVHDMVLSYGRIQIVHGISFVAAAGRVTALLGTNGAGKTTTLRALTGLHPPRSGITTYGGENLVGIPAHRVAEKSIALVPENRRVFASLTVRDNLRMGRARKRAMWHSTDRLSEVFDLFPELHDHQNARAGLLSGGQQQMLAIGRALMSEPDLLVLDEPSMGLAPVLVDRVFDALQELKNRGTSLLLAEQNAVLALDLADDAYVLESGVMVGSGTADELRASALVQDIYLGM